MKNVKNFNGTFGSGGSGTVVTYEEYTMDPQTIKFNVGTETITSDWEIRGIATPVGDYGIIPDMKLVKIGKLVTLQIPSFRGNKSGSSSNVITIITAGDMPSRFCPSKGSIQYCVDAWHNGYLSIGQDSAILNVYDNGAVELVCTTKNWSGNVGIVKDVCVSWIQVDY